MNESLTVPTATTFRELPVAVLEERRRQLNAGAPGRRRAREKISFTHLIAYAIVQATKQHPVMGHTLAMLDGVPHRVQPEGIALGLAVDVQRKDGSRGLVVPVIKRAETMDFAAFHRAYESLVDKARTNKLMPDDFAGATMSLTNPGGLGTVASVPRLMAGQGSIIAVGRDRLPGGVLHLSDRTGGELGLSKVMTDHQHLRPPRHSGRRVGSIPGAGRPAAAGRGWVLRADRREPRALARELPDRQVSAGGQGRRRSRLHPRCCTTWPPPWRW